MVQVAISKEGLVATVRNVAQLLPNSATQRSSILSDMLEMSTVGDVVPLAVDDEAFSAWLSFDRSYKAMDVHFLSSALKAADFLNDKDTTKAVACALSEALFQDALSIKPSDQGALSINQILSFLNSNSGSAGAEKKKKNSKGKGTKQPDPSVISQVLSSLPHHLCNEVLSRMPTLASSAFNVLPPEFHPLALASTILTPCSDQRKSEPNHLLLSRFSGLSASCPNTAAHLCHIMDTLSTMATAAAPPQCSATPCCTLSQLDTFAFEGLTTSTFTTLPVSRHLCKLLSSLPSLRDVQLRSAHMMDWTEVSRALAALPALTGLHLKNSTFDGLLHSDREWPALEELSIIDPRAVDFTSATAVLGAVAPALRKVVVEQVRLVRLIDPDESDEDAGELIGSAARSLFNWLNVPHLLELTVLECTLHDEDSDELAWALLSMHSLRKLCLHASHLTMGIVTRGFAGTKQLENLDVAQVEMDETDAGMLADQFCRLRGLTALDLGGVSFEVWCVLAAQLPQLEALEELELEGASLGDDGVSVPVAPFLHLPRIKSLSLMRCGIGEQGARALASYLSKLTALEHLNLMGNECKKEWDGVLKSKLAR